MGDGDEETEKLLRDAARRIENLEREIVLERKAYSNNCAALAAKFSLEQAKSLQTINRLNGQISEMRREIRKLDKTAQSMKKYIEMLQDRLESIEEIEEDQVRRSSWSVYEQIAAAWRKRRHIACFRSQVREDEEEYEASEGLTYPHTHKLTNMGEKV